jgi:hypothetical protein
VYGVPSPRPWIERTNGQLNLPAETPLLEALACVMPQGINGCGFEQQLESAYRAVERAAETDSFSHGFVRDGSLLTIIFVTDETDCSHNDDWSIIFLPTENMGNELFWSDPDNQSSPTSAVCWNAGVSCTGGGFPFDECHATDKDVDGNVVTYELAPDMAVLEPLARYVDYFKQRATYIAAIEGVPTGYPDGVVDILYATSPDPEDQLNFGIGPACESAAGNATPSVRVKEVVERVDDGERNSFSICAPSQATALTTIAQRIVARLP